QLGPADVDRAVRLHATLPERDQYTRFFTVHPTGLRRLIDRIVSGGDSIGAFIGDDLVGMASFAVLSDPAEAEVALVVEHRRQAHGIGTLLLEHAASAARAHGVHRFVAEVLTENSAMLQVFHDSGFPVTIYPFGSTCQVALELAAGYPAEVEERERRAEVASLRAVLRPGSVAVVGASRRRRAVGNAVLRNMVEAGFAGSCHPVNPHADRIEDIPAVRSVSELPDGIDLAVLCVPAHAVPEVAQECGRRGVKALVVITAGLTGQPELVDGLLGAVRRHGLRLVGPNCLGVVNTAPDVRLSATFARGRPPAGRIGVVTQSGGMAIALLDQLAALGLGVSTLVSTGDKYDVSGNDLLLWWQRDDATDMAVLYLESFGNPRKFSRLARLLAQHKPVLTIRTGSSEVAQRAAASHTAAAATPAATRDALFGQAGVIAVDSMTELMAAIAMLSWQPLPAGNRVGVISNAGGAGVLAADACAAHRLVLPPLAEATVARLRDLLPATASTANPVDTTAGVDGEAFASCLRALIEDPGIDSVIALAAPTAITDPTAGIGAAVTAAEAHKPVVLVRAGQLSTVEPVSTGSMPASTVPASTVPVSTVPVSTVPAFADPAVAASAIAAVAGYARWRSRPARDVPNLPGVDLERARSLVDAHLAGCGGGWLDPDRVVELLRCFGLPVVSGITAPDAHAAVQAAGELGYPVAVKAIATGVLHKSRKGGVLLGLRDAAQVRDAAATLAARFGSALSGVLVQPMVEPGRELLVGVHGDPTFGPLVVLGVGGVDTDLIADRTSRLVPLTRADATEMVASLRASPLLFGEGGLDPAALVGVLLRVARMADALPEIAEADLNPVVLTASSCVAVDARIRLQPARPVDPYLRRLRT
ncbi:MAG TPA: GNAT family N-acetyltransferase, partial [Pseudonocardiaceae bacterium]|nr:GNAT family N-acetyltransferase [Pseudonocardiaceae bacterium]